jgi:hypothetical protein
METQSCEMDGPAKPQSSQPRKHLSLFRWPACCQSTLYNPIGCGGAHEIEKDGDLVNAGSA